MGERIDSFKIEPTAEENSSQVLDEESFSFLSQTVQGLSDIESNEVLADFALERDNLEDTLYIFKFISEPKIFEYISSSSFVNLEKNDEVSAFKAREYAELLKSVYTKDLEFHEISPICLDSEGLFIASVHNYKEENSLYILWKPASNETRLFDALFEKASSNILVRKVELEEFPVELRTWGGIKAFSEEGKVTIKFFGDSAKNTAKYVYAPGMLKNFKEKFEEVFQKQFPDKEINIEF